MHYSGSSLGIRTSERFPVHKAASKHDTTEEKNNAKTGLNNWMVDYVRCHMRACMCVYVCMPIWYLLTHFGWNLIPQPLPFFPSITRQFTAGHPNYGSFCVQLANEHLVRRGSESSPCYACVFIWIINYINTGGAGTLLLSQSGSTNTTQSGSTRYLPSSLPQMKAASKTTANINCTFKQTKEFLINLCLWTYCTSLSLP